MIPDDASCAVSLPSTKAGDFHGMTTFSAGEDQVADVAQAEPASAGTKARANKRGRMAMM